jgi:predicted AlkP superfamily phosphohydrolase/phosphomutase
VGTNRSRPFDNIVCIGLDGATFDVIDGMIDRGRLPHLGKLLSTGVRASLDSTVPPLSAPAWVSFMTGQNPGRHGVFHFRAMERGKLGAGLIGSWAVQGKTIFDHASRAGLKVVAFGVPMTYPPWPLHGTVVSGFPTPDPRVTYSEPGDVGARIGPLLKLSAAGQLTAGIETQVENLDYYQQRCTENVVELLNQERPHLLCYVNSVTDWMAHKFWRYSDPSAPGFEPYAVEGGSLVEHFYEQADASVGEVLAAAEGNTLVVVLSDHGMGPRSTMRFSTNAWLEDMGLLARPLGEQARAVVPEVFEALRERIPNKTALKQWLWAKAPVLRSLMQRSAGALPNYGGPIDWARTRAYRVGVHNLVEGVNVNLQGREPQGSVSEDDYEDVRTAVLRAARELIETGNEGDVFEGAYRREELFWGEYAHLAPDIVLVLKPTYEFAPGTSRQVISEVSPHRLKRSSANHRSDGILIMAGTGVHQGLVLDDVSLLDVPTTILWALGVELPKDVDGRVLMEAFERDLIESHPPKWTAELRENSANGGVYTQEEARQMEAHLRDLGYL